MIETLFDSYGTDEPAVDVRTTDEIAADETAFADFAREFTTSLPARPGTIRR